MLFHGIMKSITVRCRIIKTAKFFKTVIPVIGETCMMGFPVAPFDQLVEQGIQDVLILQSPFIDLAVHVFPQRAVTAFEEFGGLLKRVFGTINRYRHLAGYHTILLLHH